MTTPGYVGGPDRGDLDGRTGIADGPEATNQPDQYPGSLFGMALPQGTGAPGSQGATGDSDPTIQPGQLNEGLSGEGPAQTAHTGAPGTTGVGDFAGGDTVHFTDPGGYQSGYDRIDTVNTNISGPSDSTQAAPGLYNDNPMPALKTASMGGAFTSTGAGGGHVMRGGRAQEP